uniref:Acyl-homoserine-lactone synthase n=2 Tax=Chromobacterium TaxID=535 RepID=Q83XU6_CHRVL|nr:acyl-homoserine-lactone synthase [Chromobacterium subtsugae]AAP32920.1 CviI [Chromobacterium violaceum]
MLDLLAFRHKIFRENLRWLPVCGNGLDRDEYDAISDNLAICLDGQVVGSVRFTPGTERYMLEKDFSRLLVPDEILYKGGASAEISRFAVDTETLGRKLTASASRLLYLSLWQWAEWNEIRWMYFVVEPSMYRRLVALGFPIRPVGVPRPLDGGVLSMAGYFDWGQIRGEVIRSLRSRVALPDACPAQWREYDYSH